MLTGTRGTARTKRMPAVSRAPWPGTSCSDCRRREAGAASQRDEIALFHSDHERGRAQPHACTRAPVQEPCARPQLEGGMRGIAQRRRWNGVRSTKAARTTCGADRARAALACAAFLLCCVQVAGGAAAFTSRSCDSSGSASVVTGTSDCGVKVSLYYPGAAANVSRPFSASSGHLRLGFAVSEPAVTVKLSGIGSRNLALGSNISFTVGNIRNLWAGRKDGFDLTLLLSVDISTVMQAMDVDAHACRSAGRFPN